MPRLVLFSYCIAHIMSEKHPQVLGSISISDSWTIKVLWATGELFLFWGEWEYRINICFLKSENSLNPFRASEVCISLKSSPLEECRVCIVGTHYINKCKKPIAFVCTTVASSYWVLKSGGGGMALKVFPVRWGKEKWVTDHSTEAESYDGDMHRVCDRCSPFCDHSTPLSVLFIPIPDFPHIFR